MLQRSGEVDGNGRLADATFARGDGQDVLDAGDGILGEKGIARGRHRAHVHRYCLDAFEGLNQGFGPAAEFFLDGAGRGRELDPESDNAVLDLEILDEIQGHDVLAEVGIVNLSEDVEYLSFRDGHRRA